MRLGIERGITLIVTLQYLLIADYQPRWDLMPEKELPFVFHGSELKGVSQAGYQYLHHVMTHNARRDIDHHVDDQ